MAMTSKTKAVVLQVVVDDLQEFVDTSTNPVHIASIYWHLGRLDVLARFSDAFPLETIGLYLGEANEALAAAKEAQS
jgi:hypothetical protein